MIARIFGFVLRWTWCAMGVLGLLVCIGAVIWSGADKWMDIQADSEDSWYPSPSGKYVARYVWQAGGGGISPFCFEQVYVYPGSWAHHPNRPDNRDHQVYQSSCSSVSIAAGSPVEWDNDQTMRIRITVAGGASSTASDRDMNVEFHIKD